MCTLEIPQKLQHKLLLLTFVIWFTFEFLSQLCAYLLFLVLLFFQSYGSFNHTNSTSLSFSEFSGLFISIFTTCSTYRKSFCTCICQVSLLTPSCQFFTNPPCSLLPCASLMLPRYLFIMLPQGSLGFLTVPH